MYMHTPPIKPTNTQLWAETRMYLAHDTVEGSLTYKAWLDSCRTADQSFMAYYNSRTAGRKATIDKTIDDCTPAFYRK